MKKNNKGFTLAELLIVVAIIAVLTAIAIPVFTAQLEKSRDAVSISNIRSAYAEASALYLTCNGHEDEARGSHVTIAEGSDTVVVDDVLFKGTVKGFSGLEKELSFGHEDLNDEADTGGDPGTYTLNFEFDDAGNCNMTIEGRNATP